MNQHNTQTKDVRCNPRNPGNPDSKPGACDYQKTTFFLCFLLKSNNVSVQQHKLSSIYQNPSVARPHFPAHEIVK